MAFPHERISSGAHDRAALHRRDEAWLDQQWSDPATRVLVVAGTRVRPVDGVVPWTTPAQAPEGLRVLLGEREGRTWFAVVALPEHASDGSDREEWVPLRSVLPLLAEDASDVPGGVREDAVASPLVLHALGIAEWLHVTRFCPRCGGDLRPEAAGHELRCTRCGRAQFPRTDPAVIMLIADGEPGSDDERCLLGRQAVWPAGRFSTLAGFCEPGETLEDAVRREVLEEVGVHVGEVTYFGNQPWPLPASLMVGFTGRATSERITVDEHEIEAARWFTRAEMRAEAEAGTLVLPGGVSISHSLVEDWYGAPLPGGW
ncbi:NAD(+) diphosphatase [Nocardioides flavescens]|uniref:NAD(+) diphosphatase n=1 Tax=Nocardioides flavescens TaxID=2691959 RepID=A0A6L7F2L5_9ACTN|nr:NAD(+) diphosphatase [Nocardioides flavescens]